MVKLIDLGLDQKWANSKFSIQFNLGGPKILTRNLSVLRSKWFWLQPRIKLTRQNKLRLKYFYDSHLVINYVTYETHLSCEYCVRVCANKKLSNNSGILIISLINPEKYFFSGFFINLLYYYSSSEQMSITPGLIPS